VREWATTGLRSQTDWLDSARPVQESFCLLRVEMVYGGEIFKNHDYSQLFLYGLLYIETGSLRKHCKDHSDQFMSDSK
jgi:hypothetical protein